MKRCLIIIILFSLVIWAGCKPKHPSLVKIDPGFNPNEAGAILVFHTISTITEGEDPNRESATIVNQLLMEVLSERSDHSFLGIEHLRLAIARSKLAGEYEEFKATWATKHEADVDFLRKIKENVHADLALVPHVYLWFKDEADYREQGTSSSTQVGMTLSLVDLDSGTIFWEATDENFKESVRTEGERSLVTAGGWDRRVAGVSETGRDMYAAPPYEDVTILVLKVLVAAIPARGYFE